MCKMLLVRNLVVLASHHWHSLPTGQLTQPQEIDSAVKSLVPYFDITFVIQVYLAFHNATIGLMPYAVEQAPYWKLATFPCIA